VPRSEAAPLLLPSNMAVFFYDHLNSSTTDTKILFDTTSLPSVKLQMGMLKLEGF
jgi:hypothetical protein